MSVYILVVAELEDERGSPRGTWFLFTMLSILPSKLQRTVLKKKVKVNEKLNEKL